jgi:hypothetical protein
MTTETLHLNMTLGQIPKTDVMISMIGGTIINSEVKLNMKLSGPVQTIVSHQCYLQCGAECFCDGRWIDALY